MAEQRQSRRVPGAGNYIADLKIAFGCEMIRIEGRAIG
jgi:hypothetical protein